MGRQGLGPGRGAGLVLTDSAAWVCVSLEPELGQALPGATGEAAQGPPWSPPPSPHNTVNRAPH